MIIINHIEHDKQHIHTMQYKAGKTYAVTAHEAVTVYYQNVLLADLAAGEQGFFVCPASAPSLTTSAHCSITECDDTSLALSIKHSGDASIHLSDEERERWDQAADLLTGSSGSAGFATIESLSSHTSDTTSHLTASERNQWDAASSLSTSTSTSLASHSSNSDIHVTSAEKTEWNNKASATAFLPDWDNAVSIASTELPYTCLANGWLFMSSNASGTLVWYLNDLLIAKEETDHAVAQFVACAGDILSITGTPYTANYMCRFVPFKN